MMKSKNIMEMHAMCGRLYKIINDLELIQRDIDLMADKANGNVFVPEEADEDPEAYDHLTDAYAELNDIMDYLRDVTTDIEIAADGDGLDYTEE